MKWFKRIKKWFQDEEIIEIEEIIVDEPIDKEKLKKIDLTKLKEESKSNSLPRPIQNVKAGDPDTKVLYQYPKGQFKFPVIPDHNRSRKKRQDEQPEWSVEKKQKAAVPQGKHEKKRKDKTSLPEENPMASKPKKIQPSNIPFRPTEIPSPIYGFKRPEKPLPVTDDAVEFELEKKHAILEKPQMVLDDIPTIYRHSETENAGTEHIEDASITREAAPLQPEAVTEPITEDEITVLSEIAVSTQAPVLPAKIDDPVKNTDKNFTETDDEAEIHKDSDEGRQDEKYSQGEEEFRDEDYSYQDEGLLISMEFEGVHQEAAVIQANAGENDASRNEGAPFIAVSEERGTLEQVEETPDQEEFLEQGEAGERIPRKRHIPFNVMMTKQDKDRWTQLQSEGFQKKSPTENERDRAQDEASGIPQAPEAITESTTETIADEHDDELPYYAFPTVNLLTPPAHAESDREWLEEQAQLLNNTLKNFNVRAHVVNVTQGPAVTRFEVQPEPGVKVNKITNLTDDIKLSLAAEDIRMEAPIPGKHTIGIEIPNRKSKPVFLREVLESEAFKKEGSPLSVALGLDISGQPIVTDLRKMPHGLIAGATGSGKSVCINTMLVSLLYKATPQEVKLLLIDPKMVELAPYNRIPHLVSPVITDVKAATAALKWAVEEMERRYELFAHTGVRDINRFNELAAKAGQHSDKLPFIVVIIDELADLMMMSPADVEEAICRIAQKARACGIHLIVATQRPSVDVITGLIKANIPTRIAFSVSSQVDSRTILDSGGAEKLLGKGDMLFAENGSSKTIRLQGTFVSDDEIEQVVNHVRNEQKPNYLFEQDELLSKAAVTEETDELFYEACEFAVNQNGASASSLQRRFHVGYNRAARLIEMMERQGILSESRGSKPRDVLISEEDLEYILETNGGN